MNSRASDDKDTDQPTATTFLIQAARSGSSVPGNPLDAEICRCLNLWVWAPLNVQMQPEPLLICALS